jgi:hypothetical protein
MGQCNCGHLLARRSRDPPEKWHPDRIFETCEVRDTPDKGRCLFTKVDLQRGDVVFREAPLFVALRDDDPELFDAMAQVCERFSLANGPKFYFSGYIGLTTLPPESAYWFSDSYAPKQLLAKDADEATLIRMIPQLQHVNVRDFHAAVLRVTYNGFYPQDKAHEDTGFSYYYATALMSHSCDPVLSRLSWEFGENGERGHEYRANRDLPAGSELTHSYLGVDELYESTQHRQDSCRSWLMDCSCVRCCATVDNARGIVCGSCGDITFWEPARQRFQDCGACGRAVSQAEQMRFFAAEKAAEAASSDSGRDDRASLKAAIDAARRGGLGQSGFLARLLEKAAKAASEANEMVAAEVYWADAKYILEQILPFGTTNLADAAELWADAAVAVDSTAAPEICEEALELAEVFYSEESDEYRKLSEYLEQMGR